jgi:hypothetical protein
MHPEELKEVRKTLDRFAVCGYLRLDVIIKRPLLQENMDNCA